MQNNPEVSIILVNYNSAELTLNCVKSIIEKTVSTTFEIIVVDNNSRPADLEKLKMLEHKPQVKLIRSRLNTGFSGGNMLGVQHATGNYYFFLNNDCLLINDCLQILKTYLGTHPKVGMCTPQMFNAQMVKQRSFGYFPTLIEKTLGKSVANFFYPGSYRKSDLHFDHPTKVDLVPGSAMFVRADLFCKIGGFDTNYFLYCEEEDLALNIQKHGFDTYVVPAAQFIHLDGGSSDKSLPLKEEFYISLIYYFRKHLPFWQVYVLRLHYFIKFARKGMWSLASFILIGAPMKKSLRFKQQIAGNIQ